MAYDVLPGLGTPLRRLEDPRLLTGSGHFAADRFPSGAAHALFLRSPHAHARLLALDTAAARALPGVLAVITAAEVAAAGLGHNPPITEIFNPTGARHREPPRLPIAQDRLRHVGEVVAMVVAETLGAARDALEALAPEFDILPAVVGGEAALAPGAPQLHDCAPGNLVCDWHKGDAAATEAAFSQAAHVSRVRHHFARQVAGFIEPRAALAAWDEAAQRLTLTTPSQGVHLLHRLLCDHVLHVPRDSLRVVSEDVGGGFGPKLPLYAEQSLVCFAALKLRRTVRWQQERMEHHLADTHARDLTAEAELALDAQGRFLAVRVRAVANFGAYVSTVQPTIPTTGMAKVLTNLYDIPAAHIAMRCAFSNTVPVDAIRGAGKPEALVLMERLVEVAARETGRDPLELRRKNLILPLAFPYRTALGYEYDSGDYASLLDAVIGLADGAGYAGRQADSAARGLRRGRGIACHLHGSGGWGTETSRVHLHPDGTVEAHTGTQSQGQGHATAYAQVIAATFGLDPAQVRVVQGDTDRLPRGGGTGGSSSTIVSGTTLRLAAEVAIDQGKADAADMLEAAVADIEFRDGRYEIVGTDRSVALLDVAARRGGLHGQADFADNVASWPAGVAWCEVEVDPDTGAVRVDRYATTMDVGTVVNPMLLAGQVHGGTVAGLGQALLEDARYDEDGQLLAATLMDYAMPRAADVPNLVHDVLSVPSPNNALGIKGMGELPTNGAPAAIVNAVVDALAKDGVTHVDLPMTSQRVWQALRAARGRAAPAG